MRRKLLVLAGLLAIFSVSAQAQWVNKPVPFSNPAQFNFAISAIDANVAWTTVYVFEDGPTRLISRTVDGGTTWQTRAVTGLSTTGFVTNLFALDATTAWVTVAEAGAGANLGGVMKTTDGGATWARQTTATQFAAAGSFPALVYFFDAAAGVAIGNPDATGFEIYTTANGGTTWARVPAASIPAPLASEDVSGDVPVLARSGNTLWFGTDEGRVFRSTNRGQTWNVSATPLDYFEAIAFRDANNGLAMDDDSNLIRTTNGGVTWTQITPTGPLHVIGLDNVPGTSAYVTTGFAGTPSGAGSSRSTDDGQTWTAIESTVNHALVDFVSPTVGWAGGIALDANGEPLGNGMNLYNGPTLSTNAALAAQLGISIYPNPAPGGRLTLRAPGLKAAATVRVLDRLGRQVAVREWPAPQAAPLALDLGSQALGMYVVELTTPEGVVRQKLVVR